eukprot:1249602-Amphidinium_carterae.2
MLKQVVADGQTEWQDQLASRVAVLERKVEECLLAFGRLRNGDSDINGSDKDALTVQLTTLSQQVDLCMRLCR